MEKKHICSLRTLVFFFPQYTSLSTFICYYINGTKNAIYIHRVFLLKIILVNIITQSFKNLLLKYSYNITVLSLYFFWFLFSYVFERKHISIKSSLEEVTCKTQWDLPS